MKRLLLALAILALVIPTIAQDDDLCDVAAPSEPTEVNFIGGTFPILDFYAAELSECDDVENLSINTQLPQSSDAQSEIRLAASAGGSSPFDIIHGSNDFINEVAAQGYLLPLNDLIETYSEEFALDDIAPAFFDAVTQDGNIYGIPVIVNTQHFYYNTTILADAGIEAPTTYEEVIEMCQTVDTEALDVDYLFGMVVSANWAWRIEFVNIYGAFGGTLLDEDNMPMFNSETGVEALEFMQELVGACLGDEGVLLSTDDLQAGIANGSIAMGHMWASRAALMDDEELSLVVGEIEFAPALYPTADTPQRGGMAWSDFLSIPATSDVDPDLLFQLIMEAADLDSQIEAASLGLVPRNEASPFAARYSDASLQTIAEGAPALVKPADQLVLRALEEFVPMVYTGDMTAQEALDAAAAAYVENATIEGFIEEESE
ncbi:MAG: extracellular solute-binding protein [Chloroflexota bacterium]